MRAVESRKGVEARKKWRERKKVAQEKDVMRTAQLKNDANTIGKSAALMDRKHSQIILKKTGRSKDVHRLRRVNR